MAVLRAACRRVDSTTAEGTSPPDMATYELRAHGGDEAMDVVRKRTAGWIRTGSRADSRLALGPGQAVALEAGVELSAGQTEKARGLGLVVLGLGHGALDHLLLHGLEARRPGGRARGAAALGDPRRLAGRGQRDRQMGARDEAALAEDHRALDGVAQLAHIARPRMRQQPIARVLREPGGGPAHTTPDVGEERLREDQDVLGTLPEGRQRH